jgi:hypothetical protein
MIFVAVPVRQIESASGTSTVVQAASRRSAASAGMAT